MAAKRIVELHGERTRGSEFESPTRDREINDEQSTGPSDSIMGMKRSATFEPWRPTKKEVMARARPRSLCWIENETTGRTWAAERAMSDVDFGSSSDRVLQHIASRSEEGASAS